MHTLGASNYQCVKPQRLLSNYSNFVKTVVLHVSEIKDTANDDGERVDRFALYDHLKDCCRRAARCPALRRQVSDAASTSPTA